MRTKHLLFVFIPALLLLGIFLFIRIIQYKPLFPDQDPDTVEKQLTIPIFPDDPLIGNKKAPYTIVAFEDFACAHCKDLDQVFQSFETAHPGQLKIIWKSLPVTKFPVDSRLANKYGYCLHKQNAFVEFKQYAFTNANNLSEIILNTIVEQLSINKNKLTTCVASPETENYIKLNEQMATILNIQTVPTLFINNKQVTTPTTLSQLEAVLEVQP